MPRAVGVVDMTRDKTCAGGFHSTIQSLSHMGIPIRDAVKLSLANKTFRTRLMGHDLEKGKDEQRLNLWFRDQTGASVVQNRDGMVGVERMINEKPRGQFAISETELKKAQDEITQAYRQQVEAQRTQGTVDRAQNDLISLYPRRGDGGRGR